MLKTAAKPQKSRIDQNHAIKERKIAGQMREYGLASNPRWCELVFLFILVVGCCFVLVFGIKVLINKKYICGNMAVFFTPGPVEYSSCFFVP